MSSSVEEEIVQEEEPRWGRAYTLILCFFALEIVLLFLFTVRFS